MGYKSFDQRRKEERSASRARFRHRFDTPAMAIEFVEQQGKRADEHLPALYEQREKQRENVEVLKIVGGEPWLTARDALYDTNRQIEYDEPWQQLRDCLVVKLITIEVTTLYVQFEVAGYRNRRICRFGPHDGLEFTQPGQYYLNDLAKRAKAILQRKSDQQ